VNIASSPYRLTRAAVLIGVMQTPQGPQPHFTEIDGHSTVLAYTDLDAARGAMPETHRLFSIVVAELLAQVPPYVAMVIDPDSASPIHVPAGRRQELIDAAQPFPAGATVHLGEPAQEPKALTAALRTSAPEVAPLRRLWRTWYQVADATPKLLVIYDVEGRAGADIAAADAVVAAAQLVDYAHPLQVLALDDLPVEHRNWLLTTTPPFYERG
jgi:hypothetical protein